MSEPAGKYTTHHPTDSTGAACPVALDEPTRAQLDQLYWTTDTPVRETARQLGLVAASGCPAERPTTGPHRSAVNAQAAASPSISVDCSTSMKMHSPGHTSAALITACTSRAGTQARLPELPGSLRARPSSAT